MTDEAVRLSRFKEAVNNEAQAKVKEILEEAREESAGIYENAKIKVEHKLREKKQLVDAECERELRHRVSAAKLGSQREILVHREKLADSVFEGVAKRLAEFRKGSGYKDWLLASVKAACKDYPGEKAVVFVSGEDAAFRTELEALGVSVETDNTIKLGGASISLPDRRLMLDCTLDTLFERERADFCRTSGLDLT